MSSQTLDCVVDTKLIVAEKTSSVRQEVIATRIVFNSSQLKAFKGFDFTPKEGQQMAKFGVLTELPEFEVEKNR